MKPLRLIVRSEMSYFHTFIAADLPRRRGRALAHARRCFLLQGPIDTHDSRFSFAFTSADSPAYFNINE